MQGHLHWFRKQKTCVRTGHFVFLFFSSSVVIASSARAGSKFEARLFWLDQARKNIIMMDVFLEELIRYRFMGIGIVQN